MSLGGVRVRTYTSGVNHGYALSIVRSDFPPSFWRPILFFCFFLLKEKEREKNHLEPANELFVPTSISFLYIYIYGCMGVLACVCALL